MLRVVISCCKVLHIKCRLEVEIESTTQSIVALNNLVRNITLQMELVTSGIVCTEGHDRFIQRRRLHLLSLPLATLAILVHVGPRSRKWKNPYKPLTVISIAELPFRNFNCKINGLTVQLTNTIKTVK